MSYKVKQSRNNNNNNNNRKEDYSSEEEYDTVIYEDLKNNDNNSKDKHNDNDNNSSNNSNNSSSNSNQLKESQLNNIIIRKKIFHERKIIDDNNDNDTTTTTTNDNVLKKFIENTSLLISRKSENSVNQYNNETKSIDFLQSDNHHHHHHHHHRRASYPNDTINNNNDMINDDFDLNNYSPKNDKINKNQKNITKNSSSKNSSSKNDRKTDANNSRNKNVTSVASVTSLLDSEMDRPSHWKSLSTRPKLDIKKDTKKKRRSDPVIKQQQQQQPLTFAQIPSSGTQNISFRPAWLSQNSPIAQPSNATNERMNDDILENDDHDDRMDDNYKSRRSSLEFAAGIGANTGAGGPMNKGSSPLSGKKRKRAIAGSFAARFQKIARCAENDETRLTNVSILPSKDPMDPRNRVEFWIDVIIEEEAITKDPFKVAVISIDALGTNEDKIKSKAQKIQHDLKSDYNNEDNYTEMLLTKFQIGSKIVAYFKTSENVNTLLQVGQVVRIYEPEICNFASSINNNNNNGNYDDTTCLLCTQLCELLQ